MIKGVVLADPQQDFIGSDDAAHWETTIPLLQKAGVPVNAISEILSLGIHITNAVKIPKTDYAAAKRTIPCRYSHHAILYHDRAKHLIEKSKFDMAADDISRMMHIIRQ